MKYLKSILDWQQNLTQEFDIDTGKKETNLIINSKIENIKRKNFEFSFALKCNNTALLQQFIYGIELKFMSAVTGVLTKWYEHLGVTQIRKCQQPISNKCGIKHKHVNKRISTSRVACVNHNHIRFLLLTSDSIKIAQTNNESLACLRI